MAATLPARDEHSTDYVPPPRGGRYENVLLAVLFSTFGFALKETAPLRVTRLAQRAD